MGISVGTVSNLALWSCFIAQTALDSIWAVLCHYWNRPPRYIYTCMYIYIYIHTCVSDSKKKLTYEFSEWIPSDFALTAIPSLHWVAVFSWLQHVKQSHFTHSFKTLSTISVLRDLLHLHLLQFPKRVFIKQFNFWYPTIMIITLLLLSFRLRSQGS